MTRQILGRAAVALALILGIGVPSAHADSITFNLGGSGGTGSIGNQRSWSSGGVTVYATAWYVEENPWLFGLWGGFTEFKKAAVGQYSPGLGVCNSREESGDDTPFNDCGSPQHSVSNQDNGIFTSGHSDYVLFLFDQTVDLTSVVVDEIAGETNVSYWLGTVAGSATPLNLLAGQTDPTSVGFGGRQNNYGNGDRTVTLSSPLDSYNALLFGAQFGEGNDFFKIKSLTINYTPDVPTQQVPAAVPEPASLVLLGCGLVGVAAAVRRRRAARQ